MKNTIKIIKLLKPLHKLIIFMAVLILTGAVIDQISPFLLKDIVDGTINSLTLGNKDFSLVTKYIIILFFAALFSRFLEAINSRLGDHLAGEARKYLTEKFYAKILVLPQSYFDSEISGKIINQLNRGIETIQLFINVASNFIFPAIFQTIATIVVLSSYNLLIGGLVLVLFPYYIMVSYFSTKKWGKEEAKKNEIEDSLKGRIQEVITNMKLVKGYNTENSEYDFVSKNLKKSNKIYAKQSTTYHVLAFLRDMGVEFVLVLLLFILFNSAFNGILTIGTTVLVLQLFNMIRRPLFAMSFIIERFQQAEVGSKEYLEILKLKSFEKLVHVDHQYVLKDAKIEFKNVSFEYDSSGLVLQNVSFKIPKATKVALVGNSGAGKTTIINLILRLYEPTLGDIFINNKKYSTLDHKWIRSNIALVYQDTELFSTTIKENVTYGTDASDIEIEKALKLANAWEFISKFKKGIDETIGERGIKLSGGQKQRIQIARAILKNAPILILDEATSSLDSKSEKMVSDALDNLMKNKLTIIIAHRFSTIQNVDRVMVIGDGKILEDGTPQELSKQNGIFKELLNYQIEGDKKLLDKFEIY